jgi:hypothetical protein
MHSQFRDTHLFSMNVYMGKSKKQIQFEKQYSQLSSTQKFFYYLHDTIMRINHSKIFAGFMIITLNIASRFVTIKLSPSMEAYFKYTFSKQLLIFAIAWMGTRDIYIALIICGLFTIFMDYLFNEECTLCVLPEQFTNYHAQLTEQNETLDTNISDEQIKQATETLEKAQKQRNQSEQTVIDVSPISLM